MQKKVKRRLCNVYNLLFNPKVQGLILFSNYLFFSWTRQNDEENVAPCSKWQLGWGFVPFSAAQPNLTGQPNPTRSLHGKPSLPKAFQPPFPWATLVRTSKFLSPHETLVEYFQSLCSWGISFGLKFSKNHVCFPSQNLITQEQGDLKYSTNFV